MPEIPFSIQWPIAEIEILPLKDSIDGLLCTTNVSNVPEFEYFLIITPNGYDDESRGETWIFLHLRCKNVKKVEADITFTIESANYSNTLHQIFENSDCWGVFNDETKEFFDPEKKYIIDGKFTVKVKGIFKFETENDAIPATIEQNWSGGELGDRLWENDHMKDFTIITSDDGGKEIKVHKLVLYNQSDFFKEMLDNCLTCSSAEITDFPFDVVQTAVRIIYNCNFTSTLSMDELMELQRFFDKHLFQEFKAKVEPLCIAQICPLTVVRLTNCSIKTNSFKLKEKCMKYLKAAFESKTALADIEILDNGIKSKLIQHLLCQTVNTQNL